MRHAPANDFGLSAVATYDDLFSGLTLEEQLTAEGTAFETANLAQIVGMGGRARLVFYVSPKTGRRVTVLVVPHRVDVDRFSEDYFYFQDMDRDSALAGEADMRWAELYDKCTALTDS